MELTDIDELQKQRNDLMTKIHPVICGFAGIGKTTAAKNISGVIDLESTPFERDWDRYTKVASHMQKQGYIVLVSCHSELRERLKENRTEYIVAKPDIKNKKEYLMRYEERGNNPSFIKHMSSNWELYHKTKSEEKVVLIEKYIEDYINNELQK